MTTDTDTEDRVEVEERYSTYGFTFYREHLDTVHDIRRHIDSLYYIEPPYCPSCIHSTPNKRKYKDKTRFNVCKYGFLPHPEVGCLAYRAVEESA